MPHCLSCSPPLNFTFFSLRSGSPYLPLSPHTLLSNLSNSQNYRTNCFLCITPSSLEQKHSHAHHSMWSQLGSQYYSAKCLPVPASPSPTKCGPKGQIIPQGLVFQKTQSTWAPTVAFLYGWRDARDTLSPLLAPPYQGWVIPWSELWFYALSRTQFPISSIFS